MGGPRDSIVATNTETAFYSSFE